MLNDRLEVVGVATQLRVALTDSGGFAVGSLSLLAPAVDVLALLDGEIGRQSHAARR